MPPESQRPIDETQQVPRVYVHPKARPGTDLLSRELPWTIELQVLGAGETITVPVRSAMTIGRSDPERGIRPDVDLGPFAGYAKGVSRRHAIILVRGNSLVMRALNTTNGTWVNDLQLSAGEECELRHRDIVTIGSLQLELVFAAAPTART